tara:strand:- start:1420 stop:1584 length:165 start_codon:yes stop_codon:yes gene_type:complete
MIIEIGAVATILCATMTLIQHTSMILVGDFIALIVWSGNNGKKEQTNIVVYEFL